MLGGMLAGHDEGGGHIEDGYVTFYGMSSDTAMNKHNGGVAEYRSSEGRTVKIPYRGPVSKTVLDILGGLRSTCTYTGAKSLKDLSKCTTFVRVTQQYNGVFTNGK
jgi:GMP reductase